MQALNNLWPSINFTVELEDNNRSITFLELRITINKDGSFKHEHHTKPTSSGKYLHFQSHCPMSMKSNIVKMEAVRVINNCSEIEDIYPHLNKLRDNFINSGYPIIFINNIFIPLIQNRELGKELIKAKTKNNEISFANELQARVSEI